MSIDALTDSNTLSCSFWGEVEIESELRDISNEGNYVNKIFNNNLSLDLIQRIDFFNPCAGEYLQDVPSFTSEDSGNFVMTFQGKPPEVQEQNSYAISTKKTPNNTKKRKIEPLYYPDCVKRPTYCDPNVSLSTLFYKYYRQEPNACFDIEEIPEEKAEMNCTDEPTYMVGSEDRFGKIIVPSFGVDDLGDIEHPVSKKSKIDLLHHAQNAQKTLNDRNIFQAIWDVSSSVAEIGEKYIIEHKQIYAIGYLLNDNRMRVKAGSTAYLMEAKSIGKCYARCRNELIKSGVLTVTDDGTKYRFTADFVFKSPSRAASVIRGTNTSGPGFWKNEAGKSIRQFKGL